RGDRSRARHRARAAHQRRAHARSPGPRGPGHTGQEPHATSPDTREDIRSGVRPHLRTTAVIAHLDTSAVLSLLVDEPGSDAAGDFWDRALRVVSVRLVRVDARAGLAQAARAERISRAQLRSFVRQLVELLDQLDFVEVDEELVRNAADLA